ncbi:uncharacterized [Tachysurus ichikawai]
MASRGIIKQIRLKKGFQFQTEPNPGPRPFRSRPLPTLTKIGKNRSEEKKKTLQVHVMVWMVYCEQRCTTWQSFLQPNEGQMWSRHGFPYRFNALTARDRSPPHRLRTSGISCRDSAGRGTRKGSDGLVLRSY